MYNQIHQYGRVGWIEILEQDRKHGMYIFYVILIHKYHFILVKAQETVLNNTYGLLNLPIILIRQKKDVIRRILAEGKQVLIKKVAEFTNEQDAYIYELAMINTYYEHLTNRYPGGDIQRKKSRGTQSKRLRNARSIKDDPAYNNHSKHISAIKIYNRLADLRLERGLSRANLAKAIGANHQTIGYLERGEYNPSLELAFRISEFFALPIAVIFSPRPFNSLNEEVYVNQLADESKEG